MIQKYRIVEDSLGTVLAPDGRQVNMLYRAERKVGGFLGGFLDLISLGFYNRWEAFTTAQRFETCFERTSEYLNMAKAEKERRTGMVWKRMFYF